MKLRSRLTNINKQTGVSLLQLMIALAIGLFLTGGILQIFFSAKQSYRVNEALARMQENARFAMEYLARDVRMADYRVCSTDRPFSLYTMAGGTSATIASKSAVYGTDGANNTPDTLNVAWAQDVVCGSATTLTNHTYAINTTGTQPTLMRDGRPLIEGVENMQILYGVDTDNGVNDAAHTPNYYVSAANVINWDQVTSVRVSLLLRTLDDRVVSQKQVYPFPFNNPSTMASDYRIRKGFTATFAVRNRLPN